MSKEIKQNIKRMQKELDEMKAELEKSKKFEWKYPYYETYSLSEYDVGDEYSGEDKDWLKHGRYRLSEQYAEHSLERNRVANRLEALVEQYNGEYGDDVGYCIVFDNALNKYLYRWDVGRKIVGGIYTDKKTCEEIIELLNSNHLSL